VVEAAVVGVADDSGLVLPHAFVVLKAGAAPAGAVEAEGLVADLRDWVKQRAAGYKVPRTIDFVDDLPKTVTGKVQRFRLRTQANS
jgi:benzoate-CoA ligase